MRITSLILILSLLTSCGGDSADAIHDDFGQAVADFSRALDGVADEASAGAAKSDFQLFRTRIRRIERRETELSSRERRKLLQMQAGMEAEFMKVFQPAMQRILMDPTLAKQLTATMMELAGATG